MKNHLKVEQSNPHVEVDVEHGLVDQLEGHTGHVGGGEGRPGLPGPPRLQNEPRRLRRRLEQPRQGGQHLEVLEEVWNTRKRKREV